MKNNLFDKITEKWNDSTDHTFKGKILFDGKSKFQTLKVMETADYGKLFTLDETNMLTEKYEFIYHDMITHPAFAVNPNIKNVLIIGGGDGGTAREVLKYKTVNSVVMVEIDQLVIDIAVKYFPTTSCSFKDKRFKLIVGDGLEYVKNTKENTFDLIIVDSTDMVEGDVAKSLFTDAFYKNTNKCLTKNGILISQSGNLLFKNYILEFEEAYRKISSYFKNTLPYKYITPDYPGMEYFFIMGSKTINPTKINFDGWKKIMPKKLRYFNKDVFTASYAYPNYIKEIIDNIKKKFKS